MALEPITDIRTLPVFPGVQEWTPGEGWVPTPTRAIISGWPDVTELSPIAERFEAEISNDAQGEEHEVTVVFDPTLAAEGYRLTLSDTPMLAASDRNGVIYGLQTIQQLVRHDPSRRLIPAGVIADHPVFPVRGQMLDVGRKYLSLADLRFEIRRMAWWKMNSLQLHLTEWNGFRFESLRFPGLASYEHYTQDELRDLDAYARSLGITIVPEIEIPGHAVWLSRYDPRLRFATPAMDFDVHPGGEAGGWMLDITSDYVRSFCKELLTEVAEVFSSPIIHIGGDELPTQDQIDRSPELASYATHHGWAEPGDCLVDFTNDMARHLASLGRATEIWEWWAFGGQRKTLEPDKSIRVDKWLDDDDPTYWAKQGWETVGVNWNGNFVTPGYSTSPIGDGLQGWGGYMHAEERYEENNYPWHPKVPGYRLGRWMDKSEARSYAYVDQFAVRGLQTIAERSWGCPSRGDAVEAFERADAVGAPPGHPHADLRVARRDEIASVTVSSEETLLLDGRANHLIDHDRRTTWATHYSPDLAILPHYVTETLTKRRQIGGVRICPRRDGLVIPEFHDARGVPRHVTVEIYDSDTPVARADVVLPDDCLDQYVRVAGIGDRVKVTINTDWDNLQVVALSALDILLAIDEGTNHE